MEDIGKIAKKESKSGQSKDGKGTWNRTAYTINGKIYSTFNKELGSFNEGDVVKIEFDKSEDGKFNNITNMMLLEPGETFKAADEIKVQYEKIENAPEDKESKSYAKMNALNNATGMLNVIALVAPQYLIKAFEEKDPFVYLVEKAQSLMNYILEK